MKRRILFLLVCLLGQSIFAANFTNLLSIDFESSEGYTNGFPLGGQSLWLQTDTNGSGISNIWPGMGQSAFIGLHPLTPPNKELVEQYPITMPPLSGQYPYVSFSTTIAIQPSSNGKSDSFAWAIESSNAAVQFLLDFYPSNGTIYWQTNNAPHQETTGAKFTNSVMYRLEVDMNFVQETWSATLSGRPITPAALPIGSPDGIINQWVFLPLWIYSGSSPGNGALYFDHIRVVAGSTPPTFPQPVLAISQTQGATPISVAIQTEPGLPYTLQFSHDLRTWSLFGQTKATNLLWTSSDSLPTGNAQRFYRAFATPE